MFGPFRGKLKQPNVTGTWRWQWQKDCEERGRDEVRRDLECSAEQDFIKQVKEPPQPKSQCAIRRLIIGQKHLGGMWSLLPSLEEVHVIEVMEEDSLTN